MSANDTTMELFREGASALANFEYDESVKILSEVIATKAEFPLAYATRGVANLKLRNLPGAIEDFTRFIELNPEDPRGYHMRGLARMDSGDSENAISDFDKAIALNPDYGVAYLSRGTAHAEVGNHDRAEEDLNIATMRGERVAFDFMMKYNIPWRNYVDVGEEDIFPDYE